MQMVCVIIIERIKMKQSITKTLVITLLLIVLSSCGTTQYNVGTGEKIAKTNNNK